MSLVDNKIAKYYLLCTVRVGAKSHIVNEIPKDKFEVFFTKKEINLFLRLHDGYYIAREIVVGGNNEREPIIVIN